VFGCMTYSDTVSIVVLPLPQPATISINNDTLTASITGNLQWYLNGAPISGATGPTFVPATNR
jgi:hypothetical protein